MSRSQKDLRMSYFEKWNQMMERMLDIETQQIPKEKFLNFKARSSLSLSKGQKVRLQMQRLWLIALKFKKLQMKSLIFSKL